MSIERSDNDATASRRRPSATIWTVVAAVVLAGGGGAWWAATADDGTRKTAVAAPAPGFPAPLDVSPVPGPSSAARPSAPGIAPGEPAPTGVVYRASGELPEGPAKAAVHRASGTVPAADVVRLARALGMRGTPRAEGAFWLLGPAEGGSEPSLRVTRAAPGTWTYARGSGGLSPCPSDTVCADGTGGSDRTNGSDRTTGMDAGPVSPAVARAAAAPVLDALGLDGAALGTDQLLGAVRVVNAEPVVDGLPTYGWSTGVQVGPDGTVTGGSGRLTLPAEGPAYPVVAADEALRLLNAAGASAGPDPVGCATPEPLEGGGPKASGPDCVPSAGRPAPVTAMTVDGAAFGLSASYVDGGQALVPSWLFTVRPERGGAASTVAGIAVDPAYLAKPEAPLPSGGEQVTSYAVEGRTLEVTFWGGVCADYTARAQESPGQVRITVTESAPQEEVACVALAKELRRTVTLDAPLAGRAVVDASGHRVPRT